MACVHKVIWLWKKYWFNRGSLVFCVISGLIIHLKKFCFWGKPILAGFNNFCQLDMWGSSIHEWGSWLHGRSVRWGKSYCTAQALSSCFPVFYRVRYSSESKKVMIFTYVSLFVFPLSLWFTSWLNYYQGKLIQSLTLVNSCGFSASWKIFGSSISTGKTPTGWTLLDSTFATLLCQEGFLIPRYTLETRLAGHLVEVFLGLFHIRQGNNAWFPSCQLSCDIPDVLTHVLLTFLVYTSFFSLFGENFEISETCAEEWENFHFRIFSH